MSQAGSWSDPVIVASSGEETYSADEFQLDNLSPQFPPDHERGSQPLEHVPKPPVYPPVPDSSEESSMPELESCSGQVTPETEEPKKIDHVNNLEVPADVNADKDHFQDVDRQDTLRQKLGNELRQAPWNEGTSEQPMQELKRLMKTVKPAHQEFWDNLDKDRDTFLRLNAATKKLEASQHEAKKDAALQNNQVEDQVSPGDACVSCHQPVGHHLLKCSRDTLQKELTEAVHEVTVEPPKVPPKVVQPFPEDRTKFQLMPPPMVPVKFSFRLNKVAKMKTGLPVQNPRC